MVALKIKTLEEVKKYLNVAEDAMTAKIQVTPKQARWILNHCNKINRRIKPSHVEELRRDMESGHWYKDIDYIGFDNTGRLVNGQHRLKALGTSNLESLELKFDFDAEQHVSMDTGAMRKWSNQNVIGKKMGLEMCPDNWRVVVSAGIKLTNPGYNMTNSELQKVFEKYHEQLQTCDEAGMFNLGKISNSSVKASLFWAYLSGIDVNLLKHFAEVLRTGITSDQKDIPTIRLRDELVDIKGNGKALDQRRAALTQQTIYNVTQGSTSNRLPSNPQMLYQNIDILA